MHHTIELAVPAVATDELLGTLNDLDGVLGLFVEREASVKPPGDMVTVHALNRTVDDVMLAARRAQEHGPTAVVTSGVESMVVSGAQRAIDDDADESPWEEFERTLRHHGRISVNYVLLMGLGGIIAVAGLVSPPVPQARAQGAIPIEGVAPCRVHPLPWREAGSKLTQVLAPTAVVARAADHDAVGGLDLDRAPDEDRAAIGHGDAGRRW